ncbi:MAG: internal scaffolding protein [Microvirus sp.]|nr:MAG: internal scaffolding protein [Microvirus sp.]
MTKSKNIEFHTPYYNPPPPVSLEFDLEHPHTKSMTNQSAKDECDINKLVETYYKSGVVTPNFIPELVDLTEIELDYATCLEKLTEAKESFMMLPSQVRAEFNNDPAQFLTYVQNAPQEAFDRLGLTNPKKPEPTPEPTKTPSKKEPTPKPTTES